MTNAIQLMAPHDMYASNGTSHASFGRSTSSSPPSSDADRDDERDEEEDGDSQDQSSAVEDQGHDRSKMKRFRLTHGQTRFLMSEFARQAHPDAAHRERLSREIPGLSPRQVQVWFQNRRAKLKRLTSDDRERMMRSRALPATFDTTQALRSPVTSGSRSASYLPSPSAYPPVFMECSRPDVTLPVGTSVMEPSFANLAYKHAEWSPPSGNGIESTMSYLPPPRGANLTASHSHVLNPGRESDSYHVPPSHQSLQYYQQALETGSDPSPLPSRVNPAHPIGYNDYGQYPFDQASPLVGSRRPGHSAINYPHPPAHEIDPHAVYPGVSWQKR